MEGRGETAVHPFSWFTDSSGSPLNLWFRLNSYGIGKIKVPSAGDYTGIFFWELYLDFP